jgi:hypothetical protein
VKAKSTSTKQRRREVRANNPNDLRGQPLEGKLGREEGGRRKKRRTEEGGGGEEEGGKSK